MTKGLGDGFVGRCDDSGFDVKLWMGVVDHRIMLSIYMDKNKMGKDTQIHFKRNSSTTNSNMVISIIKSRGYTISGIDPERIKFFDPKIDDMKEWYLKNCPAIVDIGSRFKDIRPNKKLANSLEKILNTID